MTQTYTEFRYYSPIQDGEMVRLSMANKNLQEFYMVLPVEAGKAYRQRRDDALSAISEAIETGLKPGRVMVRR